MQEVVITNIIAQNAFGTIVACSDKVGGYMRAILPGDVWPAEGEAYEIDGESSEYRDKYGRVSVQVKAKTFKRIRTSGCLIRPWLESLPSIGPTRSKRLLDAFGNDIITYLGDTTKTKRIAEVLDPDRTEAGEKIATLIQMHYITHQVSEVVGVAEGEFLCNLEECGITDRLAAKKMFRLIGSIEAFDKLIEQPYLSAGLINWKQADHLGQRLLKKNYSISNPNLHPDRLAGACDSVCRDLLLFGDTAISKANFLKALDKRNVNPEKALLVGLERRRILESADFLRAPGAAYLESTFAQRLMTIIQSPANGINYPSDVEKLVRSRESSLRPLSVGQRRAVCGILQSKFAILQGYAGTGKTTTLKVLVDTWQAIGGNVILGALSGKATLRLSRATGRLAQTLAKHLLRFEHDLKAAETNGMEMFPELNNNTMLIVDEASMVDLVTIRKLVNLIPDGARLILVGDVAQLPPVGLGQVYHDLVESDIHVFRLTEIHRQSDSNPIIAAATAIREGHIPVLPEYVGKGAGVFHWNVPLESVDTSVIKLFNEMLLTTAIDDILVLAALKRTCANINRSMATQRQLLCDDGIWLGPFAPWVSVDDPITCTRNRYNDCLMNGQIGHVNTLDPFTVRWDGEELGKPVPREAYVDLASAWAITCHRAQGSESRYVIIALDGNQILTREWLYTAITRATEQVIVVGPMAQIETAVGRRASRTTCFVQEMKYWRTK